MVVVGDAAALGDVGAKVVDNVVVGDVVVCELVVDEMVVGNELHEVEVDVDVDGADAVTIEVPSSRPTATTTAARSIPASTMLPPTTNHRRLSLTVTPRTLQPQFDGDERDSCSCDRATCEAS